MLYTTPIAKCLLIITMIMFSGQASLANSLSKDQIKNVLTITEKNWVAFRDYNGKQLIYFTHLEAWKCGISTVRYGLNGETVNKIWQLEACDDQKPNQVTKERPYLTFPLNTIEQIDIQLTYSDGSQSQIVSFAKP